MKRWLSAVLVVVCAALFFSGCRRQDVISQSAKSGGKVASEGQLIASVETRKEAEKLSELYGIELVDFSAPAALYRTEEDPDAVIKRGMDNGWPKLEKNYEIDGF